MSKHDFYLNLTDKKGREGLFREITNVRDFLSLKLTLLELLITKVSQVKIHKRDLT